MINKLMLIHYYQPKSWLCSYFLSFYLMSIFCSKIPSRIHYVGSSCSFYDSDCDSFLDFLCFWWAQNFEKYWLDIFQNISLLALAVFFLLVILGLWIFMEEDHRDKTQFSPSCIRIYSPCDFSWSILILVTWLSICQVLYSFYPFPAVSLEGCHYV
jgi:hypothetical protein